MSKEFRSSAAYPGRPPVTDLWGVEAASYYDTPEFREYTVLVAMTIKGIGRPANTRDIKRALGDGIVERFNLFDVLELLQTAGDIEKVRDVPPMTWLYTGIQRKTVTYQDYGRIPSSRTDRTRPIPSLYEPRETY